MITLPIKKKKAKESNDKVAVTIYDIARQAGLSHSAVSMALRGSRQVSERTRERVRRLADQLGYRPNASAVKLKNAETRIIAAIMPLELRACNEIVLMLQNECESRGYQVLWQNLPTDPAGQRRTFEYLCTGYSDAALLLLYDYEAVAVPLERYLRSGRCAVLFSPPVDSRPNANLLPIENNNTAAVYSINELLVRQGHRAIVHIQPSSPTPINESSYRTIREAMHRNGVTDYDPSFRFAFSPGNNLLFEGYRCTDLLLSRRPEVSAVNCPNDIFAIGMMRRLIELGKRIPQDISLVGSDNTVDANYATVRLTSIDLKYKEIALLGCRMLCERLNGAVWADPPDRIHIQAEVVLRDSTGPGPYANVSQEQP